MLVLKGAQQSLERALFPEGRQGWQGKAGSLPSVAILPLHGEKVATATPVEYDVTVKLSMCADQKHTPKKPVQQSVAAR